MTFGWGLLIGFLLGIVASVVANSLGGIARSRAKKTLRKNMKITLLDTPETYSQLGVNLWLVELQTMGDFWNKLVLDDVYLELSAKASFIQVSEPNDRCLGQVYDTTLGFGSHNIQFQLKANYPRRLAVMQRDANMWLQPFTTAWKADLKGDWDMEVQIIENGQIIFRQPFPLYIRNSNSNIS